MVASVVFGVMQPAVAGDLGYYTGASVGVGWISGDVRRTQGTPEPSDDVVIARSDFVVVPRFVIGLIDREADRRLHVGPVLEPYLADEGGTAIGIELGIGFRLQSSWWLSGCGAASFGIGQDPLIDQSKLFRLGARIRRSWLDVGIDALLIHDAGYERVAGRGVLATIGGSGVPDRPVLASIAIVAGTLLSLSLAKTGWDSTH